MNRDQIRNEIIKFFSRQKSSVEGNVLLLNGEWGSGKTYLWDKQIKDSIESDLPISYLSCFNTPSVNELKKTLLTQLIFSRKDTKMTKYFRTVFDLGLESLRDIIKNKVGLDIAKFEIDPLELLDTEMIVCIDDLERITTEDQMRETLGFISYLNEKKNSKVLILANETRILNSDSASARLYKDFKEKSISCRFNLKPDIDLFISLKKENQIEKVKNYLDLKHEIILQQIQRSKVENLRIISRLIYFISLIVENDIELNDANLKILMFYVFVVNGELSQEVPQYYNFNPSYLSMDKDNQENLSKITILEKHFAKYYEYQYVEDLFNLVYAGDFEIDKIKKSLEPVKEDLNVIQLYLRSYNEGIHFFFETDSYFIEKYNKGINLLAHYPPDATAAQLAELFCKINMCKNYLGEELPQDNITKAKELFKDLSLDGDTSFKVGSRTRIHLGDLKHVWEQVIEDYDKNINSGILKKVKKSIETKIQSKEIVDLIDSFKQNLQYVIAYCELTNVGNIANNYFTDRSEGYYLILTPLQQLKYITPIEKREECLETLKKVICTIFNSDLFEKTDLYRFKEMKNAIRQSIDVPEITDGLLHLIDELVKNNTDKIT